MRAVTESELESGDVFETALLYDEPRHNVPIYFESVTRDVTEIRTRAIEDARRVAWNAERQQYLPRHERTC